MAEKYIKNGKTLNVTVSFVEDEEEAEMHFENAVRCILNWD